MENSGSITFHQWPVAVCAALLGLCCQLGFAQETSRTSAENRGITRFLKRLDRNGDQILDQNEMAGQAATYLQSQGFDTSNPIPLSKVLEKYDPTANAETKPQKTSSSVVRKVPGFGIESDPARVPGFEGAASMSAVDMEAHYGRRVMDLVDRTLEGYDRNKNGALDPDEVATARWGDPPATESDANQDGTISKIELAERYLARDRDANRSQSSRAQRASPRSNVVVPPQMDQPVPVRSPRTITRSRAVTSNPSRPRTPSRRPTPRSSTTSSTAAFNAGEDRYARYANGLMTQYDSNKDGKLDQDELSKMRRPPNNADVDRDGFVTSAELITVLSSSAQSGQNETPVEALPESRRPFRHEVPGQPDQFQDPMASRAPRTPRDRGSFSGLDANGDGQVQMHEFSQEWDGEVLQQFQAKDINGDGVITSSEWNGR